MKPTHPTHLTKSQHITKMNTLPLELINIIITYILKITDKRQFTQTCITYNNITKPLIQNQETTFKIYLSKIPNTTLKINYFEYSINYCMENFTLELCNDSYFNKIPNHYLTPTNSIIVKALTIYGQIELLTRAMENGCNLFTEVRPLYYYNYNTYNSSCAHAVISGNIDVLEFVRSHGCQWNYEISDLAMRHGYLHIFKFLETNGCHYSKNASLHAAEMGHIDVIQWMIENNYAIHSSTYATAVDYEHPNIIELLAKYNFVWDDNDVCTCAQLIDHCQC